MDDALGGQAGDVGARASDVLAFDDGAFFAVLAGEQEGDEFAGFAGADCYAVVVLDVGIGRDSFHGGGVWWALYD